MHAILCYIMLKLFAHLSGTHLVEINTKDRNNSSHTDWCFGIEECVCTNNAS